jgi:ribosomal protein S18 acetylase RimI-like enzyme
VVQLRGGGAAFAVPAALNLSASGGQPLPAPVREKMESFFGTSFADVRVHVGNQAPSIGAMAFTHGSNLYFAPGQYNPNSAHGQKLLGHELTHVLQQRAGRVKNPFGSGVAVVQDHGLEAEADRMGQRAAAHAHTVQAKPGPVAPPPARRRAVYTASRSVARAGIPGAVQRSAPAKVSGLVPLGNGSYRISVGAGGYEVGSVLIHDRGQAAIEVTDLAVDPSYRKQGLGGVLMASAARAGLQLRKSKVTLASQDNGTGHLTSWYKKMGFAPTGANKRGYPVLEAPISRALSGVAQGRLINKVTPTFPFIRANRRAHVAQAMKRTSSKGETSLADLMIKSGTLSDKDIQLSWPPGVWEKLEAAATAKVKKYVDDLVSYDYAEFTRVQEKYGAVENIPTELTIGTITFYQNYNYKIYEDRRKGADQAFLDQGLLKEVWEGLLAPFMQANGQLPYILSQPWYLEGEAAIDIEINFYWKRGSGSVFGFHKDTGGDNLFFNLIFNNKEDMLATEWTEDLSTWETLSKKTKTTKVSMIEPQKHAVMKERMPKRLIRAIKDLRQNRRARYTNPLTDPLIRGGTVGPLAYISAVDELGWHSTPSAWSREEYRKHFSIDYDKQMSKGAELSKDPITGVVNNIKVDTNISGRRRANSLVDEKKEEKEKEDEKKKEEEKRKKWEQKNKLIAAYNAHKYRSFLRTWVRVRKV